MPVCQPRFATEGEKVPNRGWVMGRGSEGRYDRLCWLPFRPPRGLLSGSAGRHLFLLVNKLYVHTARDLILQTKIISGFLCTLFPDTIFGF